ncbi:uncharacterized protein ATC70_004597 [Mucor velutinosus]|uniref:Uncharacterized protein n=1 Tax=Mucor velutinosus TaxID=708070 RepID=A0AAN7DS83_9FUNG|nr:hypothetical protein ATC70_004597 [Mucor velutinosus]
MENQDFYTNNRRSRSHHQQQQQQQQQQQYQYYQLDSRADRASSWRSSQKDPDPDIPSKRSYNINEKSSVGIERLNTRGACQRDDRVSSWCNDVQRHRLNSPSSSFTVFNDNQLNQELLVQPGVGAHLNPRGPPGLPMPPFLQSTHVPSSVSTLQLASPSPAKRFTPDDLRSSSSIVLRPLSAVSHIGFSAFNQRAPESVQQSQSFSPWPTNINVLQLRDSNQQNLFDSSLMLHKHNELGMKAVDTCKPTPAPPRTWSQIAAKDSQQVTRHTSSTTIIPAKATESRISTMQTERTGSNIPLVKEEMDIDMAEASAIPASQSQTAPVDSPIRKSRYITDSLAFISSGVSNDQNMSVIRPYIVLKIKNISWNVSSSDIYDTLSRYNTLKLPDATKLPQCVHVFMDIKTGKTLNTAYVELEMNTSSPIQIDFIIGNIKIPQAQGRHITVTRSSYDELCNDLFSQWKGEFTDGMACPHTDSRDSSATQKSQFYIGQRDLQRLLDICKFFKTFYNRKCAERPFEFLITIIMNIPWKQPRAVTTAQRDIIYECYKLATEALYNHMDRPYHSFDDELLPRMVRAAITCDGFTVKQKKVVLGKAKMECPPDIESYMQEPILHPADLTNLFR